MFNEDLTLESKGDLFRLRLNGTYDLRDICFGKVGFLLDPSLVCNGHGACVGQDMCICESEWNGPECEFWYCYGVPSSDPGVCSGHGVCSVKDVCNCSIGVYGPQCESYWYCYGFSGSDADNVCSGHGVCATEDACECSFGVFGAMCDEYTCFGVVWKDNQVVCSQHGLCIANDTCRCVDGYSGAQCDTWSCFDVMNSDNAVCSQRGVCMDVDTCVCEGFSQYGGSQCEQVFCGEYLSGDIRRVCNGHGRCLERNDASSCVCDRRYHGDSCDRFLCFGQLPNDTSVCFSHGMCVNPNECVCNTSYSFPDCFLLLCFGIPENSPNVCYGHGKCGSDTERPFECVCEYGYSNVSCNVANAFVLSLREQWGVWFLLLPCLCLSCWILLLSIGFTSIVVVGRQMEQLAVFERVSDFELLLAEQRMHRAHDYAHLKITERLFEVDYSTIKLLSKLGAGGSGGSVYLCEWQQKRVAFKCFKSVIICSNRVIFDEFEHEVSILASVSHANIVAFYGACLHPPRIGYLMEYCELGDLKNYFENVDELPSWPERVRMMKEIAMAMVLLHAKGVIHRDLKAENVLLSKDKSIRVMDFGLSKLIQMSQSVRNMTAAIGNSSFFF